MKNLWRVVLSLGSGILLLWLVFAGTFGPESVSSESALMPATLVERTEDPVLVTGSQLFSFDGVDVDDLVLYAHEGGNWLPIPFQIDERTITNTYVLTEDGLLDGNDELVFMAFDAGDAVDSSIWPDDAESQLYPRYAITVTDPLSPTQLAWAYLYRSTTLPRAGETYVNWDAPSQTISTYSYTVSFDPETMIGLAGLTLAGSPDLLDRQKFAVTVTMDVPVIGPITEVFNEESDVVLDLISAFDVENVGAIRAVGGNPNAGFYYAYFGSRVETVFGADLSDSFIDVPIFGYVPAHVDALGMSMDLRDPTLSGFAPATYFDGNTPSGVPIDGTPDGIPAQPPFGWYQWHGAPGSMVTVMLVEPGDGILTNYYRDDDTPDGSDTGDQQHFADTGFQIVAPESGDIGFIFSAMTSFVFPPGVGNVGAWATARAYNPLLSLTQAETYEKTGSELFLPLVVNE